MFVMRKYAFCIVTSILIFLSVVANSWAQGLELDRDVMIEAGVGDSFLTVSGFISPFASLVLDTEGTFLKSTVADSGGNFTFRNVRVKESLESFCLKAVDFKRVGESIACIQAKPVAGKLEKHGIFLPPTIGLSRRRVTEGESVSVFGYSMPNALARVHIEGRGVIEVSADNSGYYQAVLSDLKRGRYVLYATAELEGQESLVPVSRVEVEALSGTDKAINLIIEFLKWLWRIITSVSIFIWIVLIILILIFILLYKLYPGKFRFLFFWKKRKKEKK